MRNKTIFEKMLLWLMVTALTVSNIVPAAAATAASKNIDAGQIEKTDGIYTASPSEAENTWDDEEDQQETEGTERVPDEDLIATPSEPPKEKPIEKPDNTATPSESIKKFDIADMPQIGTDDFTRWFFNNVDQDELWDYVLLLLYDEMSENYEPFMNWIAKNELRFAEALKAHTGVDFMSAATGDLWDEWTGAKMNWDGTGSMLNPFKITSLSELMGLSEAVTQGEDFTGTYFELQTDINIGALNLNSGCWNPIGWYKNTAELSGKPVTAFAGCFDGAGNTISGLKFTKIDHTYSYLGLFGYVKNATIKNLAIEADEVSGADNVALLAGCVEGNSTIYNVTVSGAVYANGDAGGIAGEVTGGSNQAVIENCTADNVTINSEGKHDFVGGIAGNVQRTDIVDASVVTLNGDSDRIQGKGYVGGIAGRQNQTNIYNAYVSGTIGGNMTTAVGGMTGLYESGNLIVARFDGQINPTNNGAASHEGTFIGTREPRNGFSFGTGRNDNLSFLYARSSRQAKQAVGSGISGDNTWTLDAHIGYFTDYELRYTQVAGTTEQIGRDRYFYEELEDGIKYIITQKLGKDLNINYADGEAFRLDHYAPGNQGEPIRGYLVSVPRIDTKNANGTYDNDVATLTANPSTNNSYYRLIDKDNPAAVAPGCTIVVATAAKNKDGNRYQMVYDPNADGKVKSPTYTDENSGKQNMTYVNGGSYTFVMPEVDTELNVEYVKVTTELTITPLETKISVTQTRTGDRKNPNIITEVRNSEGILIAKYINGNQDISVQVLPIYIHADHNGAGSAADRTVMWSIDDTNLLGFAEDWVGGYTAHDARVISKLDSDFIQGIIKREVKAQADSGYSQAIRNTIYTDSAVVTAVTNPATSVDNKAVTGTSKVNVTFQILDQTTLRVESMDLNQTNITFNITRRLTGDRKNPNETYIVTEPVTLDVTLNPSQPFYKNVKWEDLGSGKIISLTPMGVNNNSCEVSVVSSQGGTDNPAWLQNIINADNTAKAEDGGYLKLSGNGQQTETVVAISEDQTHGVVKAICNITINFRTDDQTIIHPERVIMSKTELVYDLGYQFEGDLKSVIKEKRGFGYRDKLSATVLPDLSDTDTHKPYNRAIRWISSDPEALSVSDGKLTVNENAVWIKNALKQVPYSAETSVTVTAVTEDGEKMAFCNVLLKFKASVIVTDRESETFNIVLTKTGNRNNPSLTWTGAEPKQVGVSMYSPAGGNGVTVKWIVSDNGVLAINDDGVVTPVLKNANGDIAAEWIKVAMENYPYKAEMNTNVIAAASDGSMKDQISVKLTFTIIDKTYSSGGGGGGGSSSGGGGGSSSGITPSGSIKTHVQQTPAGSVNGTWAQNATGKWLFTANGRTYVNEWAYINNPYAQEGQNSTDWFRFSEEGFMVAGWYTEDRNTYYLNPISDNTLGRMCTGWQWIDNKCYYFDQSGQMLVNTTTPDGYTVNEMGRWTVNNVVQIKEETIQKKI